MAGILAFFFCFVLYPAYRDSSLLNLFLHNKLLLLLYIFLMKIQMNADIVIHFKSYLSFSL